MEKKISPTWGYKPDGSAQIFDLKHKNAFALAVVPMIKPPGAVDVARETYKGISVPSIRVLHCD